MSEKIQLYDATDDAIKDGSRRKLAVEAALEIIRAYAQYQGGPPLPSHFSGLSAAADYIQAALEAPQKRS